MRTSLKASNLFSFSVTLLALTLLGACGGSEKPSSELRETRPPGPPPDLQPVTPVFTAGGDPAPIMRDGSCAPRDRSNLVLRDGIWLTNIDSNFFDSRETIREQLTQYAAIGIREVYPVIWNKGILFYDDPSGTEILGKSPHMEPKWEGRDLLQETIEEAHRLGLHVYPWFEWGFKVPVEMPLLTDHPEWRTQMADGTNSVALDPLVSAGILNPFLMPVQEFMLARLTRVLEKYDIDGIQIDDHLSLAKDWGYDDATLAMYKAETGRIAPRKVGQAGWADWMRWRANKITNFVGRISALVHAPSPGKKRRALIVSPNPFPWSYDNFLQDWPEWVRMGYVDALIPQIYRPTVAAFEAELESSYLKKAKLCIPVMAGVLTGLKSEPKPTSLIVNQIASSRRKQFDGASFFFSGSIGVSTSVDEDAKTRFEKLRAALAQPIAPDATLKQPSSPSSRRR